MTSSRWLGLLVFLAWVNATLAQQASNPPAATAADERAARVAERYKAMLLADPVDSLALDRLWKSADERGTGGGLIEEYRRLAEAPGAGAPLALICGHLLKRAGRLDEAETSYEHAEKLDPSGPLPPLARAELALARSQPENAAPLFAAALAKLPAGDRRQTEILLKLGAAWMSAGEPSKATESWETVIAHDPSNVRLRLRLADAYEKNALPERALGHYQYIESHADPAERAAALRDLARLHETRGEFDAARDALERGLALTARDNWLHGDLQTRLIRLYQRAGRVPELEARWRVAVESAPSDLGGWLRLEALAQAQGDLEGERRALEKLVALAPGERAYTLRLARRLADDGELRPAASLYDSLLKTRPDGLDLILARGDLDLQLGQPAAAVDRIEARLARTPADESVVTPALAFFLEHHLDAAAEKCLRAEVARAPGAVEPALALAKFFFAQRKGADARATLAALTGQPGTVAERADRWSRCAEIYREQNLPAEALRGWQEAARLQPQSAAPLLATGDFLLSRGDKPGASEQFERAVALAAGPEQTDVERKLFGVLQSMDDPGGADPIIPSIPGTGRAIRPGQPLARHLAALQEIAGTSPTGENWLRLARWQSWARLPELALASASRAVEADPADLAARELMVSVAVDLRRPVEAEAQLQELAARDSARKNGYLRQLANLKMEDGDPDGAVAILTQAQQSAPGSREALTDLALAQQRSDRWYDAAATWERAYALPGATPAQRDDIRRPLLAACERLGRFPRAFALLRAAVDEQTDAAARMDLFHQMAAFCRRHDLASTLREEYEKRLAARPDDYFLLTALAELHREDGREREAYALLQKAFYSSPDPARSLGELADQAEQLGEDAEAVGHLRRLIALPDQATAANLEKLAGLEDADGEDAAAARTWESIVARFPRDTTALGHAADFFQQSDETDRARALLRQLVAVDGTDIRRGLLLANLDVQAGDGGAARSHFEQVLAQTAPEAADEPLRVPAELEDRAESPGLFGTGRLMASVRGYGFTRASAPDAPESDERRLRLQAIGSMSRLLFPKDKPTITAPGEAQAAWLQRWRVAAEAGAKSEPLAAFYFAGQRDVTLSLLAGWAGRDDTAGDAATDALLNAGLRLGGYERLAAWAWQGDDHALVAARGQKLLGALRNYLGAGGRPGPGMAARLFPPDVHVPEVLWSAAQDGFAVNHWYTEAAELGERVLAVAASARASYGVDLAAWELYAGKPGRARDALRQSIDDPDGDSLETGNAVFVALRGYYLSLPESARAAFVADYLARPRGHRDPAHETLCAMLLHGLSGDEAAARRDLDQLLALRMMAVEPAALSPDIRRWAYLLGNGEQLQAWNLPTLAIYLWRRALAEVGAFDRLIGDADNTLTEIRHRLLAAELATAADPQQARERLQECVDDASDPAAIATLAGQLWTDGERRAAARLYEILCRNGSASTDYWPNLSLFYEVSGDGDAAESLLGFMLEGTRPLPPGVTRAQLICDLAARREQRGDVPGACRLLEHARLSTPAVLPVLLALAGTYERAGRWDEAAAVWREGVPLDPGHTARLGLARVEEHRGHPAAAVEILRGGLKDGPDPERVELAARLTRALLADHRPEEARQLGFEWMKKGAFEPLPAVCAALAAGREQAMAREILAAAVLRAREPAARFHLQAALVEQSGTPGEDSGNFVRQMRRLGKLSQVSEILRNEYGSLLYPLAHGHGVDTWLESELQRGWKHGQGDPAIGVQLAGLFLQDHREDALREVVQTIDGRPDLPENLLYALATSLVESGHAPLALPVCERLATRFPQKTEYQIEQALALWKSDRRPEAEQCLSRLEGVAIFHDDVLEPIAAFYLRQGEKTKAVAYLQRVVENDSAAARSPGSWLQLAQFRLDENNATEAGRLLRVVYARPAATDLLPLVHYLKASGRLAGDAARQMPASEFPLTFTRRARLLAAVSDDLKRNGRTEDARCLVEAHAEFLVAAPALTAELVRTANPATVATVVDCLERAAGQRGVVPPSLGHELATLYAQWAVWDANDPVTSGNAVAHLSRAFDLEPDNFAVAAQLAKVCLQHHQPERAAQTLAAFLTPEALPAEREQARQILSL